MNVRNLYKSINLEVFTWRRASKGDRVQSAVIQLDGTGVKLIELADIMHYIIIYYITYSSSIQWIEETKRMGSLCALGFKASEIINNILIFI